jgi:hypothetical protein
MRIKLLNKYIIACHMKLIKEQTYFNKENYIIKYLSVVNVVLTCY